MSAVAPDSRAWYRELWPWLLMLPPAGSVAGGVMMVYLALHTSADLAVGDYSRIEQLTHERFVRDARAARLGVSAEVRFAATGGTEPSSGVPTAVTLTLSMAGGSTAVGALQLTLQHVADSAADRTVTLYRSAGSVPDQSDMFGAVVGLRAGRYDVELSPLDGGWRLAGVLDGVPQTLELSAPADAEL